ncbi:Ig-like domain-containing protein, partial [Methanoculleus sp.]|uniref:Ig-like domain-containing protein n=1 Tax=Methanoculleus sp. TaxID=90427 RepID=UPI00320FB0A5
ITDAADDWRTETGGGSIKSPLRIVVTPAEGRYGDTLLIAGTYAGGTPGTPVEVYVDSRAAATVALGDDRTYAYPYRVGRVPAGPHLAYAVAGPIFSEVATFEVLPGNTAITLALAEVNGTAVACTGNLTTDDGRPVTGTPVLLRVDGDTLIGTETDGNGTYEKEIVLPAGEHTLRAEFHGAGYPLNASESPVGTITVPGEGLSPLPLAAALAALFGTGWYLRRRQNRREESPVVEAPVEAAEEATEEAPQVSIAGLPPREAATVLFCTLRARLGIAETKTPRDCARIAPDHAGFFGRYERVRYAGETPSEEELRAMEEEARGGDEDAA